MTKKFNELGLTKELLSTLNRIGFETPTEIQSKVIPESLLGKDIIGKSATGSGKTLAFGASIIEKIKKNNSSQALILVPTRELAQQVSKSLKIFSQNFNFNIVPIYGGVSIEPQIKHLRTAEIIVGTPGRILDHIERRTIDLSKINFLVLDEADRMLDMGFIYDVVKIIEKCPQKRQTFLFSATISEDVKRISRKYMAHPLEVSVKDQVDPSKLEQIFYEVRSSEKFSLLVALLKDENSKHVMVFCNTKRNADFTAKNLQRYGLNALALHGDLNQNKRNRVMEQFHNKEITILVCTDVASRGIDVKNISHVYNYDVPKTSIEYIHRIGRTARAGKEGKAITILSERDYENFRNVEKEKSLNIKRAELPKFEIIFAKSPERKREWRNNNFRNKRFNNRNKFHRRRY